MLKDVPLSGSAPSLFSFSSRFRFGGTGWSKLIEKGDNTLRYSPARLAISIGVMQPCHAQVFRPVVEQAHCFLHDPFRVRSNQLHRSSFYGLGPLRLVTQYQNRLTERGPFFLNAS